MRGTEESCGRMLNLCYSYEIVMTETGKSRDNSIGI